VKQVGFKPGVKEREAVIDEPATMSKQRCRTLQSRMLLRRSQTLLRHCRRCVDRALDEQQSAIIGERSQVDV